MSDKVMLGDTELTLQQQIEVAEHNLDCARSHLDELYKKRQEQAKYTVTNRDDPDWVETWDHAELLKNAGIALSSMVLSNGYTLEYTANRIQGAMIWFSVKPDEYGNIKNVFEGELPCHLALLFPDFSIKKE